MNYPQPRIALCRGSRAPWRSLLALIAWSCLTFHPEADSQELVLTGSLQREVYTNIPGIGLADLTNNARFPDHPDLVGTIPTFEVPSQFGDNFGERLSGYLVPPVTGDYVFYVASDDQGALFLSSDAEPSHKTLIAFESAWRPARMWQAPGFGGGHHISASIRLEAGRRYYVEALHKEGGGGDNFAVAWQLPGSTPPEDGSEPIPGDYLLPPGPLPPFHAPVVTVVTPQEGAVFVAGTNILLGANAPDSVDQVTKLEFYQDGNLIGRGAGPSLTPLGSYLLMWSNVPPGSYSLIARATDQAGLVGTSAPVHITVGSNQPPWDLSFQLAFFSCSTPCADGSFFVKNYTLAGPVDGGALLPGMRVVPDASQRYFYAAHPHAVLRVDALSETIQEMSLGGGVPALSWPMGVTYDSKRNRVLLVSLGGEGFLYAYAPDQGTWSLVASMQNRDLDSIVYHPSQDAIYGLEINQHALCRFSPDGAYQSKIPVPWLYEAGFAGSQSELVSVGDYLVLLTGPDSTFPYTDGQQWRMYLIDPRSGEVRLTYMQPGYSNQPPSIALTLPAEGSTSAAGERITLAAQASDADGTVKTVEFFADGRSLGLGVPSSVGAYRLDWQDPQPGTHVLRAKATDDDGAVATSPEVHITVMPGPLVVSSASDSGPGSLRQVVAGAPAGATITFTITGSITLTSGSVQIAKPLNLQGPGAQVLALGRLQAPGLPEFRILEVLSDAVTISGLTIQGGAISKTNDYENGAGILNRGTLSLSQCVLSGHHALGEYSRGGAICNFGALQANGCTFAQNTCPGYYAEGGAIYNYGALALTNCTFSANSVGNWGGAVHNDMLSQGVFIDSCTFTANSAGDGGGIFNRGAPPDHVSPVYLRNTIVAGNTGADISHCSLINSGGYNLIGTITDPCGSLGFPFVLGPGDRTNVTTAELRLGPLQLNGGSTPTHAPLRNSAAINTGPEMGFPVTDQRGVARPYGGRCDIGAVESDLVFPSGSGSLDLTFDPTRQGQSVGLEGEHAFVSALALQPDDKVLLSGFFIGANGVSRRQIARLNGDGSTDLSFRAWIGPDHGVDCLAVQSDGKVLIGGDFTSVNGEARSFLARLNPDGSLDRGFAPVLEANDSEMVTAIVLQPDGKILVGGNFLRVAGEARFHVARLNSDGTLDLSFQPAPGPSGALPRFNCLALQPDGQILIGFSTCQTDWALRRLKPDGNLDTGFALRVGMSYAGCTGVRHVVPLADGRLIIQGNLSQIFKGSVLMPRYLARLNYDGSEDPTYVAADVPFYIYTVLGQPDGKLLIAGTATDHSGLVPNGVARLNADGSLEAAFNVDETLLGHRGNAVRALALRPDSCILLGKEFSFFSGDSPRAVVQLLPDGHVDEGFQFRIHPGQAVVSAVVPLPDGKLIAAGHFTRLNNVPRVGLAGLNHDGTVDPSFVPPNEPFDWVNALARQSDGRILVGGLFQVENPLFSTNVLRLNPNGSLDSSFRLSHDLQGCVYAIALQSGGRILLGGDFNVQGYGPRSFARLYPDGTLDTTFNQGAGPYYDDGVAVREIVVQPDDKILIGGDFSSYDGVPRTGLARLNPDGSLDETFQTDPAKLPFVNGFAVQPDGKIVVVFGRIARLNRDGSVDPSFHSPDLGRGSFYTVALQPDGKVLAGGYLADAGGSFQGRAVVRLNADGSPDFTFNSFIQGMGDVRVIALQADGAVLFGGVFEEVNGVEREGIARLLNDLVLSPSFVSRQLPSAYQTSGIAVQLLAQPASTVAAYAVEDQPPMGWSVSQISHSGVYDPATGKVKFGPFFDREPRSFSYQVVAPAGFTGVGYFAGSASADGSPSPILGPDQVVVAPPHPADLNPVDWLMRMDEVTAYASAWRTGGTWVLPPNPIPMDYVTRAAALWRGGEGYWVDPNAGGPPLWWVNLPQPTPVYALSAGELPAATRHTPQGYVPGEAVQIAIEVSPGSGTLGYAVEELVSAGAKVEQVSQGGYLDTGKGTIRWGPFLDSTPRVLSYQIRPAASESAVIRLQGKASFDGGALTVGGPGALQPGSRLRLQGSTGHDGLVLELKGALGARFVVETSTDLVQWTPWMVVTNDSGSVEIGDSLPQGPQRFYRAKAAPQ